MADTSVVIAGCLSRDKTCAQKANRHLNTVVISKAVTPVEHHQVAQSALVNKDNLTVLPQWQTDVIPHERRFATTATEVKYTVNEHVVSQCDINKFKSIVVCRDGGLPHHRYSTRVGTNPHGTDLARILRVIPKAHRY